MDFLISIKLTPRDTKSGGTWVVKYKNKSVCHIRLNDNEYSWNISFSHFTREKWFVDYDKYFIDNELPKFISDNFHSAPSPNPNCIRESAEEYQIKRYLERSMKRLLLAHTSRHTTVS